MNIPAPLISHMQELGYFTAFALLPHFDTFTSSHAATHHLSEGRCEWCWMINIIWGVSRKAMQVIRGSFSPRFTARHDYTHLPRQWAQLTRVHTRRLTHITLIIFLEYWANFNFAYRTSIFIAIMSIMRYRQSRCYFSRYSLTPQFHYFMATYFRFESVVENILSFIWIFRCKVESSAVYRDSCYAKCIDATILHETYTPQKDSYHHHNTSSRG